MFWLALVVVLTIVISFTCSIWEAALYSVPPGRVEALRQQGTPGSKRLAILRDNMDRPVAAILSLNTIANTMGATVAGSLVHANLGSEWLALFSGCFVFLILVASEIIPKTLGFFYSGRLAPLFAWPIQITIWLVYPAVILSEWLTRLIKPRGSGSSPTEEDILSVAHLGAKAGKILPEELRWVRNALRLNNLKAEDIMTPRSVMNHLDAETRLHEIKDSVGRWIHSRIPLTKNGDPDKIVGVALRPKVIAAICEGQEDARLADFMHAVTVVPFSMRGHLLLKEMIEKRQHLFIVADEYGGTAGLVTLEDVIEAMLGEQIVDELDEHASLRDLARSRGYARTGQDEEEGA